MTPGEILRIEGQDWQVATATPSKVVLRPVGGLVAKWRKKHDLTQREAAEILGISQGQLARIESGTRGVTTEIVEKISSNGK